MSSAEAGWSVERARGLLREERPADIHLGLDRLREVLARLGCPERCTRAVLVAGTNGKGSTCAFLESILRSAGLRTGMFTSPHLVDWPERICLDGRPVAWDELARALGHVEEARAGTALTTFELLTAAAFLIFGDFAPDVAVLEVGLGGRLDATRVVQPRLCLLTRVGMDHMDLLGHSLQSIAREKAGILEPGVPALTTSRGEALETIVARARAVDAPLQPLPTFSYGSLSWLGRGFEGLGPGLAGQHQWENACLASAAAITMDSEGWVRVPDEAIRCGLERVVWPGRLQWLPGPPPILLDGAHNPLAARSLAAYLAGMRPSSRIHLLFGLLADKDAEGTLSPLLEVVSELTLVRPSGARGLEPERLLPLARGLPAELSRRGPWSTLQMLRRQVGPGTLIVVTGSLHMIGEILASYWSNAPGT